MTNNDLAEKLIDKLRDAGALLSDDDLAARRAVMKFIIESRNEESGAYDLEKAYRMACKRLHFPDKSHRGLEISIDKASLTGATIQGSNGSNKRSRYAVNDRLAEQFEEIANFEEQWGEDRKFNCKSIRRAGTLIARYDKEIKSGKQAREDIIHVGATSEKMIDEYISTGKIKRLEDYRNGIRPEGINEQAGGR